jgi:hypothetical protein
MQVMPESVNKRLHDHTGHMIFTDGFAFCGECEMHWTRGERGWFPDDEDRSYRGREQKPKFKNKGKVDWQRKTQRPAKR